MSTPADYGNPETAVAELQALLDQLSEAMPPAAAAPTPPPAPTPAPAPVPAAEDAVPEPAFRDLDAFMRQYLSQVVERRVVTGPKAGIYWCDKWWAHPEAISRLYALWREWEKARADDTMSTWWIHHFDPHLATMTTEFGPFAKCEPGRHSDPVTLAASPAPREVLDQLPDS